MNKYIVVKDLKAFGKVGDVLVSSDGQMITFNAKHSEGRDYVSYKFVSPVSVELLKTLGAIIELDWKPKKGDVFYSPIVTNTEGKRFTKHIFSETSECHKRWLEEGLCFFSSELADKVSEKMLLACRLVK